MPDVCMKGDGQPLALSVHIVAGAQPGPWLTATRHSMAMSCTHSAPPWNSSADWTPEELTGTGVRCAHR
jgi:hypothetical protein